MTRVAVIGSGISGLGTAWLLAPHHDVHVFEQDSRIGGHTHTHNLQLSDRKIAVDSGFIVHNEINYPNLVKLFAQLDVPTCNSDMSFGVHWERPTQGFNWSSRGLAGIFSDQRSWRSPRYYKFLFEIRRFNSKSAEVYSQIGPQNPLLLKDFLDAYGFSSFFREHYIYPMAGSVWSMNAQAVEQFPFSTLISFFKNHGMLGLGSQFQWKTIPGGTNLYIQKMMGRFQNKIHQNQNIKSIRRVNAQVSIEIQDHPTELFDHVVFACPAPSILKMLNDCSELEQDILSSFKRSDNKTVLHRDRGVMPDRESAWASWNYPGGGTTQKVGITYHMNRLQPLETKENIFVSLNPVPIDETYIEKTMHYTHPIYSLESVEAQRRWHEISSIERRTHFAGAYWGYGFHEDGWVSAIRVAQAFGVSW